MATRRKVGRPQKYPSAPGWKKDALRKVSHMEANGFVGEVRAQRIRDEVRAFDGTRREFENTRLGGDISEMSVVKARRELREAFAEIPQNFSIQEMQRIRASIRELYGDHDIEVFDLYGDSENTYERLVKGMTEVYQGEISMSEFIESIQNDLRTSAQSGHQIFSTTEELIGWSQE